MTIDNAALQTALNRISESLDLFRAFTETLNAFLVRHNLGVCSFDEPDYHEYFEDVGYDLGMFQLENAGQTKQLLYFHLYTNGEVSGENFTVDSDPASCMGGHHTTWNEAVEIVLETIRVMGNRGLAAEKMQRVIAALKS